MIDNQRPGVYSRVEISGGRAGRGRGAAALLLPCREGDPAVHKLESYRDALDTLGDNRMALECARLLFEGAQRVSVVIAPDISRAVAKIAGADVRVIVSGFTAVGELTALREHVETVSESGRECIAFAGVEQPQAALNAAQAANSGRVVLCCPAMALENDEDDTQAVAIYGACALAAVVLGASSPVVNFNGLETAGLRVAAPLAESEVQRLIRGGVCVFEQVGGRAELIRAVSTHTSAPNGRSLLRSLNTVLIIDDVLCAVRGALKGKLGGSGRVSIEGVRDLVAVEMQQKKQAGIIASFEPPRCRISPSDPTIALVEIGFGVAHLLSQIRLTAYVRV